MNSQKALKNPRDESQPSEQARSIYPSQKGNDLSIALEHARTVLVIVALVFAISIVVLVNQSSDRKTIAAMSLDHQRDTARLEESIARMKRTDMKVLEHKITELRLELAERHCSAIGEASKEIGNGK